MKEELRLALVEAIQGHPEILQAAITGSLARPAAIDQYSDLDLLLVARDVETVRNGRRPARALFIWACCSHRSERALRDSLSAGDRLQFWLITDESVVSGRREAFRWKVCHLAGRVGESLSGKPHAIYKDKHH